MLPPVVLAVEPIEVGEAKLPAASDSWTVKLFPEPNGQALLRLFVMLKVAPWQKGEPVTVGAASPIAVTVRLAPLSGPVTAGLEPTTRILYPAPAAWARGIVTEIVPPVIVERAEPIVVGAAKLPAAFESCTVKLLPVPKLQALLRLLVMLKVDPAQNVDPTTVGAASPIAVTVRLAPLSGPVTAGLEPTTRILYPVPAAWARGIVTEIVPPVVVERAEPIVVGAAKLPAAFESCTVKSLLAPKLHALLRLLVILKVAPWQKGEPATVGTASPMAVTVRFTPLFGPVTAGLEPTTRILYPVPAAWARGIVTEIVPPVVVERAEPIVVGAAKLPAAFESWTVKLLPVPKLHALLRLFVILKVNPAQNVEPATVGAASPMAVMVRLAPLFDPVTIGVELTTLILYPTPAPWVNGMVAAIVPAETEVSEPILVGAAKLPAPFESCAVKILPPIKDPVIV
jgi:hypothetical protein